MRILFVYPEFLATFWSWKHLLKFVSKKAAFPPLGLLTVAAMLPQQWKKKLIDMNAQKLTDAQIEWADYVFVSAMTAQKDSALKVIARCNDFKVPVVLGGPILEEGCEKFKGVSHFFIGESEEIIPQFLADLKVDLLKKVYKAQGFPNIGKTPIPLWGLINPKDYASGLVQYSRACPFKCTFCNSSKINGPFWRAKSPTQFISEVDAIYQAGFRGSVLLADENFIGKENEAKLMLSELIAWQKAKGYPIEFTGQAPVTLSDSEELMEMNVKAGVVRVFLGLETFSEAALRECKKLQNLGRDLVGCVHKLLRHGIDVASGFIVGFDSDNPETFVDDMIGPVQKTGIVMAMVDTLQAQIGTVLYEKLKKQGRLLKDAISNMDCCTNFVPKMPTETLVTGYKRIVKTIYSPKEYYERILIFLENYDASKRVKKGLTRVEVVAFLKSIIWIGILGGWKTSYYYWKTLLVAFFRHRQAFSAAVAKQIYGMHFKKIADSISKQ